MHIGGNNRSIKQYQILTLETKGSLIEMKERERQTNE
jgi:hypothetical protein